MRTNLNPCCFLNTSNDIVVNTRVEYTYISPNELLKHTFVDQQLQIYNVVFVKRLLGRWFHPQYKEHGCLGSYPFFFFLPRGLRPQTPRSGGRAVDPFIAHCFLSTSWSPILCKLLFVFSIVEAHILHIVFFHLLVVHRPWEASHLFKPGISR